MQQCTSSYANLLHEITATSLHITLRNKKFTQLPRALIVLDWDKIQGPVIKAKYPEIDFDPDLPMKIYY